MWGKWLRRKPRFHFVQPTTASETGRFFPVVFRGSGGVFLQSTTPTLLLRGRPNRPHHASCPSVRPSVRPSHTFRLLTRKSEGAENAKFVRTFSAEITDVPTYHHHHHHQFILETQSKTMSANTEKNSMWTIKTYVPRVRKAATALTTAHIT